MAWQEVRQRPAGLATSQGAPVPLGWALAGLALALLVGWRHEVGGDWVSYLGHFNAVGYESHHADWWWNDPGYRLLEWLAFQNDWGMHGVNLMAAAVFSFGLLRFCRELPRPWLALAVAVPYLVIILGMGYSRQGVALGCLMAGLVGLGRGQLLTFVVWTVLGATFHKSAVLLLPMAALAATRNRTWATVWVGLVVALAYSLLLEDSVDALRSGYLEAEYQSEGALVRLLMNALPAALLLWHYPRLAKTLPHAQQRLWYWLAWASMLLMALYLLSPSSTAVDRVGLYLLPLQLMVFAHLPEVLGHPRAANQGWVVAVLGYYATVQFVWLNFATHAFAWLPYRFYPLEVLF
ncbi:EpsG family protein [Hydrogenophaga sp.]|uniref:EpsG family protein n=1 Tax=Hydrogenophaga sp. TaxID=1904254 RepID=UPI00286DE013|nr:EpsG family protein [Hydrogenophaga sp.]